MKATVKEIKNIENLHLIKYDLLTMISLDLPDDLKIGTKVELNIKPTSVIIAKNYTGVISLENELLATVKSINKGELLASIVLKIQDFELESIITSHSLKKLDLKLGDSVSAFINASCLSISKIIND